ncbi:MAG: LptF/LptG family permease [Candidatus Omnitrophica bacterium]|nr:LptF/LptG family permease [Candidatus Omnitrophota bacterium]
MKLIRQYFLKEFLSNFFLSLLGITLLMILGNLIKLSDMIVRKGVESASAFKLFLCYIPYLLEFSLPLSILLATLLTMGRASAENEIISLKTSGVSLFKILSLFLVLGLITSLLSIILQDRIIPQAHFASRKIVKKIAKDNPLSFIEPGVFIDEFKDFVLFTRDVEENTLRKVFIYELKEDSPNLIYAEKGDFVVEKEILKIKLQDGFIEGPQMQYRIHFKTHFMHLPIEKKENSVSKKPADMTLKELEEEINALRKRDLDPLPLEAEFHKKISISFSSLVFVLLGFGAGGLVKHREKSINFGICFLSALGYYLLSLLGETLVLKKILPVCLGIWLANLILLTIGVALTLKICKS